MLEQLSSEHQTDGNPQFDIPVESKEVPDERPRWSGLTLIMVCRNVQKAETARVKLLSHLDRILEARRAKGVLDEYGQNFRQNLVIEIEKCDFTSIESVVGCARGMKTKSVLPSHSDSRLSNDADGLSSPFRYPYLNHLVLNAGAASFVAIDWFKLIVPMILHPVISLTVVSYIIQAIGERTFDGFGYIWQCNVFGPYIFVSPPTQPSHSTPQPLTTIIHPRSLLLVPRTTTSTGSLPLTIRRRLPLPLSCPMDNFPRSYAFLPTGRLATRRNGPFLRSFEIPDRPPRQSA